MAKTELEKLLKETLKATGSTVDKLARDAGISNNTLLLINTGKWTEKRAHLLRNRPDSPGKNRDIKRWTNALTRVARLVGDEPEKWITAAGLPYDPDTIDLSVIKAGTCTTLLDQMAGRLITLEDLSLIRDVIERVGAPIPLATALTLLSSQDRSRLETKNPRSKKQ